MILKSVVRQIEHLLENETTEIIDLMKAQEPTFKEVYQFTTELKNIEIDVNGKTRTLKQIEIAEYIQKSKSYVNICFKVVDYIDNNTYYIKQFILDELKSRDIRVAYELINTFKNIENNDELDETQKQNTIDVLLNEIRELQNNTYLQYKNVKELLKDFKSNKEEPTEDNLEEQEQGQELATPEEQESKLNVFNLNKSDINTLIFNEKYKDINRMFTIKEEKQGNRYKTTIEELKEVEELQEQEPFSKSYRSKYNDKISKDFIKNYVNIHQDLIHIRTKIFTNSTSIKLLILVFNNFNN